jgi:hypothetical protein
LSISCARKDAHGLRYISSFPYKTWPKARYQKIRKTFSYYSRTITNLTNIWHRPEQPWKSHTWIFRLSFAIFEISMFGHVAKESQAFKVSDGTRVVGKCLRNFLIPCFGSGFVWEWRNYTLNRAQEIHNFQHWTNRSSAVCQQNFPGELRFRS